jgi:hypothetical protein
MSRDDELEPILGPWMKRNALDAPPDLLLRVMREVDTMSERERTSSRSWLSLFGASPATGWILATAAVAVMAIAVGFFIANLPRTPTAGPGASPTPTPVVTPALSGTDVIDRVIAAWNSGDGPATRALYALNGEVRILVDAGTWTEMYSGRDAISATVVDRVPYHFAIARTGTALELGHFVAEPFTWTATNGSGQGICVYQIQQDSLVVGHYCFGESVAQPAPAGTTSSAAVRALVIDSITAQNASEGARVTEFFTPTAEWRSWINGTEWGATMIGRDEITAAWDAVSQTGPLVTLTGGIIQQGSFVAYAATATAGNVSTPVVAVLRINADHLIQYGWVLGDRALTGVAPAQ